MMVPRKMPPTRDVRQGLFNSPKYDASKREQSKGAGTTNDPIGKGTEFRRVSRVA